MIEKHKLDIAFGTAGSFAGFSIIVAGIIVLFSNITAIALIVLGSFFAFTSTSCLVDFQNKRVKFTNNLFGFYPVGKWVYVTQGMKIKAITSRNVERVLSRSNREINLEKKDYRLILYNSDNKPLIHIMKLNSSTEAMQKKKILNEKLGLE